jgi:hypothetical protein
MHLGVPFIAPRGLGAVEVSFGRTWLPSICGCTGLSGGAPDSSYITTTNHLIGHLPSRVALDYPVAHQTCQVTLPTVVVLTWPALIARSTVGTSKESLLAWHRGHVRCTPDYPLILASEPHHFPETG